MPKYKIWKFFSGSALYSTKQNSCCACATIAVLILTLCDKNDGVNHIVTVFGNSNKKLIIHLYMQFRIHVKHVGLFVNDSKVAYNLYQIRGHQFFRSQTRRGARYTHYRHNVRNNMYMILLNYRGFLFCLFISWIRVFYQPSFLAVRPLWTELNFIFLILSGLQLASKEKLEIDLP